MKEGNVYLSEEAFFKIEIDTEADWQMDVYDTDQAGGDIAANFGGQAKNAVSNPENGKIGKINGNFIVNSSSAILNNNFAEINGINADFISNQAYHGGAIYNRGKIGDISRPVHKQSIGRWRQCRFQPWRNRQHRRSIC